MFQVSNLAYVVISVRKNEKCYISNFQNIFYSSLLYRNIRKAKRFVRFIESFQNAIVSLLVNRVTKST